MKHAYTIVCAAVSASLCSLCTSPLRAQQTYTSTGHSHYDSWSDDGSRAFVFHQGDETPIQSGFDSGRTDQTVERRYSETHPGTYVLFLDGDQMHRLDDAKDMAEVADFHERMRPLEKQQRDLGTQQRPLSARMKALGLQMKAAHDTTQMQDIGSQMSALGKQMSALGSQQSAIGKQQGEIGKAMQKRVAEMIDACLKNNSCPVV